MRPCLRVLLILAFAASAPVFCYSEQPAPDEAETNARLLERWRTDPEHFARLQNDLRAFWQLPPDRQERLRQFDLQLHDTDSIAQKRLWGVMERYNAWFDRQREADQRRIAQAADRNERLLVVKQLREEQWLQRQPQKVREDLTKLSEDRRHDEIARQRKDERQRVAAWMHALKGRKDEGTHPTKPARPADFPPDAERYINEILRLQLTLDERERLKAMEGMWPYYTRTVLELSEKHPVKLPGPSTGPVRYTDLPKDYHAVIPLPKDLPRSTREALNKASGKWPDYALAVTEYTRAKNPNLPQLGPSRLADFNPPVRQFLETTLPAKLSAKEKEELQKVETRWPDYPMKVLELAGKHGLEVPLMRMPNAGEWWEKVGGALPEVPDRMLRDFALNDLSVEERGKLQLSVSDPTSRDRLVQEYFKKNPTELKRLQRLDQQMLLNAGHPAKTKPGL